jgi:hypothetical protein
MASYNRGDKVINDSEIYSDLFDKREIEYLTQYKTKVFSREFESSAIPYETHYWSHGDRYYKLANDFYGDFKLWWIIAAFNNKPSEADLTYGEEIRIPTSIGEISLAIGG